MASLDDVHNQEPSDVTGTVQNAQTYTVSTKSTSVIGGTLLLPVKTGEKGKAGCSE